MRRLNQLARPLIWSVLLANVAASFMGCGDSNADNTAQKPPPANVVPQTKGPEEIAADRRAARRAGGAPGVHQQADGGR